MDVTYFKTPAEFGAWLERNHSTEKELWVGFYRKDSGKTGITWPQAVDEALCFGWIDGIRKRVDEESYANRFTPRKRTSNWSAVNIARVADLGARGRMRPAGIAAFEARREDRSGVYTYEQRTVDLVEPYASTLRENARAQEFFEAQPASYRKLAVWWILSAKREETRLKRLATLVEDSSHGRRLAQFARVKKVD